MAKRRIRDALSLFVDDASKAKLDFEVRLPKELVKAMENYLRSAGALRLAEEKLKETQKAIVIKAKSLKLTNREASELLGLGLSHQRIHQLSHRH